MPSIEQLLDKLDPPLKHRCELQGQDLLVTLVDPGAKASVHRRLRHHELEDSVAVRLVLLHAVNEIRGKGSHAKLEVLPMPGEITFE